MAPNGEARDIETQCKEADFKSQVQTGDDNSSCHLPTLRDGVQLPMDSTDETKKRAGSRGRLRCESDRQMPPFVVD